MITDDRPGAACRRPHPRPTPTCACSPATGSAWSAATAPARRPRSPRWPARACRTPARSSARGEIGYLPQDPRSGDLDITARDRVLSARGLDVLARELKKLRSRWPSPPTTSARCAATAGSRTSSPPSAGTPPRARPPASAPTSACPTGSWPSRCAPCPAVSAAASSWPGSCSPTRPKGRLLLDEPTNHLDADSITWLRGFLASHHGGLIVISHDVELLEAVVNKVWYLDANRADGRHLQPGLEAYLEQRETDERRRSRERANAEQKIDALQAQADKMRAKATKAKAAQSMDKRAERLLGGLEEVRVHDKVAKLRFPTPAPCGKTPLTAEGLSKTYGSLEIFTDVDLAVDRGTRVVVLGLNGAGKTTLLRMLGGLLEPGHRRGAPGHGLRIGYYAQEHETLDVDRTMLEHMRSGGARPAPTPSCGKILGAFLFSGDDVDQPAGMLSGGEKTRLAMATLVCSGANVLLLDEPTNNLDPASREQVLDALRTYPGAIVLVTHDEGAVQRAQPGQGDPAARRRRGRLERGPADLVELA